MFIPWTTASGAVVGSFSPLGRRRVGTISALSTLTSVLLPLSRTVIAPSACVIKTVILSPKLALLILSTFLFWNMVVTCPRKVSTEMRRVPLLSEIACCTRMVQGVVDRLIPAHLQPLRLCLMYRGHQQYPKLAPQFIGRLHRPKRYLAHQRQATLQISHPNNQSLANRAKQRVRPYLRMIPPRTLFRHLHRNYLLWTSLVRSKSPMTRSHDLCLLR